MMLINFLIVALIVFGAFIIIRFMVRYMLAESPEAQQTVLAIVGIVCVILLLIAIGMLISGRGNQLMFW